ncbi:MAG: PLP-dependent transferase [Pseudonocardiales bacterium]|nr:PLP-dependent transferase [Pseudonocardiales bacterium]MBV9032656.1 PLP-dependent transferase [Pseudonocardiales bacterium]MBW0011086.1 PLP-dependent transferase [Pseudonocardiales bacterium]
MAFWVCHVLWGCPWCGPQPLPSTTRTTTRRCSALAGAGIAPGQVRLSVGVEDPEELLADLRQALDTT